MTEEQRDGLLLSMKDQMEESNSKLAKHDELLLSVKDQVEEMGKEVRSISKSVAVIEVEHGSKIQALLDTQVGILKKLDSFENRFESNEGILDNHSDRIWRLESEVGII